MTRTIATAWLALLAAGCSSGRGGANPAEPAYRPPSAPPAAAPATPAPDSGSRYLPAAPIGGITVETPPFTAVPLPLEFPSGTTETSSPPPPPPPAWPP